MCRQRHIWMKTPPLKSAAKCGAIADAIAKDIGKRQGQRTDKLVQNIVEVPKGEQRNPQNIAEYKGRETRDIAALMPQPSAADRRHLYPAPDSRHAGD